MNNRRAPLVVGTVSRRRFLQLAGTGITAGSFGGLGTWPASALAAPAVGKDEPDSLTWWIPACIHVGNHQESDPGEHLRKAVADVNAIGNIDYAVALGDLVEDEYAFLDPFIRGMNQLHARWTYVLGNHDFTRDAGEPILPPHFSGRAVLGMRFIFLSDEAHSEVSRDLVMHEEQERWFWQELEAHRDKPIFLFTHQPHWELTGWEKLRDRLGRYNIKAWFSGHKHRWDIKEDSGHGFVQVNMHSIGGFREDDLSSLLHLQRLENNVQVMVRFRDHAKREWVEASGKRELHFSVDLY